MSKRIAGTYRSVMVTALGGPEVLRVVEHELRAPAANEARIRVLAASVTRPDLDVRTGRTLYGRTPLGRRPPFVPGYAVVGEVEAVERDVSAVEPGARVGALTVVGGYTEQLYWRGDRLIPVPRQLDPVLAAPVILDYVVAYQSLHRRARVRPGATALVLGAGGGIGSALLQLGELDGLKLYGVDTAAKEWIVQKHGGTPIDHETEDFVDVVHRREPDGIDVVLDGVARSTETRAALSLLRPGGTMVVYGDPATPANLCRILWTAATTNLRPNGRSLKLYGTSAYTLGFRRPFLEDWATLFELLASRSIDPVIARTFPLSQAADAHRLLESGDVVGNVVLVPR